MTSEMNPIETSEFLRRRKLRLQQVREQSKDIAKKLRERASAQTLNNIIYIDTKKDKEYIEKQEKVVLELEELYSKQTQNIGDGHRKASALNNQGTYEDKKLDKSRQRAKVAAALLREQKQEQLDQQKKLLTRKVLAREIANEISRDKTKTFPAKLLQKCEKEKVNADKEIINDLQIGFDENKPCKDDVIPVVVRKSDMATQWDNTNSNVPDFEPSIPPLPIRDKDIQDLGLKTTKCKRMDLFAVSDEMPPSLRRDPIPVREYLPVRPSLTLVSEFLHNRNMRLREPEPVKGPVKRPEDLQTIKQTILRSRASKDEVRTGDSLSTNTKENSNRTTEGSQQRKLPVTVYSHESKDSKTTDSSSSRKNPVTVYNHMLKDATKVHRDSSEVLVVRYDEQDEDAFTKAMKKTSSEEIPQKDIIRTQDHRSRIAINKQNVDKEYKDTMSFLNTLSKTKNTRPNKKAFMDETRQRSLQESRQHKMNSDFRRIQKETLHGLPKPANIRKPKSPQQLIEDFEERSFQYSWRPVPDNDTPCEAHNLRERNSVRFHDHHQEYKLQHRHSPPTKEKREKRHPSPTNDPEEYSTATSDFEEDAQKQTGTQKKDGKKVTSVPEGKERKKKSKLTHETVPIPVKDKQMEVLVESRFIGTSSNDSSEDEQHSPLHVKEGIYKAVSEKAKGDNVLTKRIFQFPSRVSPRNTSPKSKKVKHTCKKKNKKDAPVVSAVVQTEDRAVEISLDSDNLKTAATNTIVNAQETQTDPSMPKTKVHPSGANSTTSYKSSVNCDAKISEAIEANFVKVFDDGVQEGSKFYIGASGFVNDQSYEVVIQLRKKNAGMQAESKTQFETTKKFQDKGINVDHAEVATETERKIELDEIPQNQQQNIASKSSLNENPIPIPETTVIEIPDNRTEQNKVINPKLLNANDNIVTNTPVYITNVHVTGPVAHITEPTTVLTKPSKTSVPRHVMSSSASTTYMSPPDNIRPTYLKNNANNQDTDADISEIHDFVKKCEIYHTQSDKSHSSVTSVGSLIEKRKCPNTPPNTRSQSNCSHKHKHTKRRSKSRKSSYVSPYSPRGLKSHKKSELSSSDRSKQPTGKTVTPNKLSKHRKNKIFKQEHVNRGKSNLNPIVKNYVNKVLSLNKEGLRAMEVMNQDCSYVPTPGSSVVNIPNNLKNTCPNTYYTKISLGQITEILKQQIIDDIARDMNPPHEPNNSDSNGENYRRNQKRKSIHNRKKSLHKIKSLYISKNFKIKPLNLKNLTSERNESKQYVFKKPLCRMNSKTFSDISGDAGKSRNNTSRSTNSTNSKYHGRPSTPVHETKQSTSHQRHCHHSNPTSDTPDDNNNKNNKQFSDPTTSSTQTMDKEMKIVKQTSDKLENMQKIADLTEKCTQRLTNLAKILEEVRKKKSAAYNPLAAVETPSDTESNSMEQPDFPIRQMKSYENDISTENIKLPETKGKETTAINYDFLKDLPKPNPRKETPKEIMSIKTPTVGDNDFIHKIRSKPPPALANINLKNSEDYIIPHELSTVLEVDSPMSLKTKSSGTNQRNKTSTPEPSLRSIKATEDIPKDESSKNLKTSPNISGQINKSKARNKLQMMDLNKFNEIMLKPFMSLEEYAKQCNIGLSDEGSHLEDFKSCLPTDELTSVHSENTSIPDVIAELLKRNLISEPFKFDTASHIHSTTASSESSVSVFALSKIARDKKKEPTPVQNKDTSDSMSVSSNPDLENAFKNIGLGWASSTLKKTKERLALSSSSSSSSCKMEKQPFKQTDITPIQPKRKDAMKIGTPKKINTNENSNIEQQTSTSKIMTVKEFLENELAKRITFSQSRKEDTDQFVSMYDAKVPEEIRNTPIPKDNESFTNLNRVRTSTPVQMFKSTTYDTSSSTNNNSNGLFNMDELSSVKGTSSSAKNQTTSDKYDLTIPNLSLRSKKDQSDSKTDSCDPGTGS